MSRLLHVSIKDLSVAGTKDKRGVTVQRVSLNRHNKTVEDVWKAFNGLGPRRSIDEVMLQRGERGIRAADFNYRKSSLELGMLKGNAFVITLRQVFPRFFFILIFMRANHRNVKVDSLELLDEAMDTMKQKGFINYYGTLLCSLI